MCCPKSKFSVETIRKSLIIVLLTTIMLFVFYFHSGYSFRGASSFALVTVPISMFMNKTYAQESMLRGNISGGSCGKYCEYKVKSGDNLSKIFKRLQIKNAIATVKKLDEADADFLLIDTIQPGYILRFWLAQGTLTKFEMEINVAKKIQYTRKENGYFHAQEMKAEGEWIEAVALGTVKRNFYLSATAEGMLTKKEYQIITDIFKDRINFVRDLHPGDKFEVIYKTHMVGNKESGATEILAVIFRLRKKIVSAYLHQDGYYYDENGESLQSNAFLPYPLEKKARVSSHFNPYRFHPVTGNISPHNGTDFAVDIGTPVVAVADGVVSIVRNHPYAGKYVVIDHGTQYKTRYLHNSVILVKKGQTIQKGQRIALSGNTGRVSGAHLHYEVLINGKPVDAMKRGLIPMAFTVPEKEMKQFKQMVTNYHSNLDPSLTKS